MKYLSVLFTTAIIFFSCQTAMTPKQTCIKECENGYRSCMDACRPYSSGVSEDNRSMNRNQYNISDSNCSNRCYNTFSGCKKTCDATIPTSYDKSGKSSKE